MSRVDNLRRLAELNLCERCFQMYKASIEPTVKEWLYNPLDEWKRAESYIFQTTMRVAGAYKTSVNVISIREDELTTEAKLLDVEIFRKFMYWTFKKRIDYLHKKGIIGDSAYTFLDEARKIRNKIHEDFVKFSEKDLLIFEVASILASQFFYSSVPVTPDEISSSLKSTAEILAKQWLDKFGFSVSKAKA